MSFDLRHQPVTGMQQFQDLEEMEWEEALVVHKNHYGAVDVNGLILHCTSCVILSTNKIQKDTFKSYWLLSSVNTLCLCHIWLPLIWKNMKYMQTKYFGKSV